MIPVALRRALNSSVTAVAGVAVLLMTAAPAAALRPDPLTGQASVSDAPAYRVWVVPPPGASAQCRELSVVCGTTTLRGRWAWPLQPRPPVLRRFVRPRTAYGAGHRGIDLAAVAGQQVRAVADGVVSHVGVIAGKPTVTIAHPDGLRSTYEPVRATVVAGGHVSAGDLIGTVAPAGSHCVGVCVHLGAVRGSTYVDPLALLGWWRVRLLPIAGS